MDCHSWVNSTLIDVTGIYFSNTVSKKGKLHENKTLIMDIGSTTQVLPKVICGNLIFLQSF